MNWTRNPPTPERHVLGVTIRSNESLRFTLVFTSATDFYVERYDDSPDTFDTDRLRVIPVSEFHKYDVDGVSLEKLVADKFRELSERRYPQTKK
jgi:hypothetical protein